MIGYNVKMSISFQAAVLRESSQGQPYTDSTPLHLEKVTATDPLGHEVLVKIAAASLCRSDLSVIDGVRDWPLPIVPGHEASGVVQAIGPDVTTVKVGDHVVLVFQAQCGTCQPCRNDEVHLCINGLASNRKGELLAGGSRLRVGEQTIHHHMGVSAFAEMAVVSEFATVPLPKDIPLEVGALFGCGVMCGAGSILNTAQLRPGESVAIVGVGGVGSSAILGAKLAGASQIIAVDVDPGRLKSAQTLGATHTVLATTTDPTAAAQEVLALSNGGTDVALESAGKLAAFETAFASARRGARVVTLGLVDPRTPFSLDVAALVTSAKTVVGSYIGSCNPTKDIPTYIEHYRSGAFPLEDLITHRMPLSDINIALDQMAQNVAIRQIIQP